MFILPETKSLVVVAGHLGRYLPKSRFTCQIDHEAVRRRGGPVPCLRLRRIRLKRAKDYCGQHAGPCRVTPGFARPHPKTRYLEGADWVAFDDMLNDILDRHKVVADVWSHGNEFVAKYVIRRGAERRTAYPSTWVFLRGGEFEIWDCDPEVAGFSSAWFGTSRDAARSSYAAGTPGIPEWRLSRSRKWEKLLAANHHGDH